MPRLDLRRPQQTWRVRAAAGVLLLALLAVVPSSGTRAASAPPLPAATVRDAVVAGLAQMNQSFQDNRQWDAQQGRMVALPLTAAQDALVRQAMQPGLPATAAAWYLDPSGAHFGPCPIGCGSPVPFAGGLGPGAPGASGLGVAPASATVRGRNPGAADSSGTEAVGQLSSLRSIRDMSAGGAPLPAFWPLALFPTTTNFDPSVSVTFYDFNSMYAPGDWSLFCFRGSSAAQMSCGENDLNGWLATGFNPGAGDPAFAGPVVQQEVPGTHSPGQVVNYSFFPVGHDGNASHPDATGVWVAPKAGNGFSGQCPFILAAAHDHRPLFLAVADRDNGGVGRNLRYHVVNVVGFEIDVATCPGTQNSITGHYLGYGWPAATALGDGDLSQAAVNGQTVLQVAPDPLHTRTHPAQK